MYEDLGYWMHCADSFGKILDQVGVNSLSLYWCPNDVKVAEQEKKEPASAPLSVMRRAPSRSLSHSKLLEEISEGRHRSPSDVHESAAALAAGQIL